MWPLNLKESMAWGPLVPQAGQPRAGMLATPDAQFSGPFLSWFFTNIQTGTFAQENTHTYMQKHITQTVLRGQGSAYIMQLNIHNTVFFLAVGEGVLLLCKICFMVKFNWDIHLEKSLDALGGKLNYSETLFKSSVLSLELVSRYYYMVPRNPIIVYFLHSSFYLHSRDTQRASEQSQLFLAMHFLPLCQFSCRLAGQLIYSTGVTIFKNEPLVLCISQHELKPEAGESLLMVKDVMERSPHTVHYSFLQMHQKPQLGPLNTAVRICPVHHPLKELQAEA